MPPCFASAARFHFSLRHFRHAPFHISFAFTVAAAFMMRLIFSYSSLFSLRFFTFSFARC